MPEYLKLHPINNKLNTKFESVDFRKRGGLYLKMIYKLGNIIFVILKI